MRGAEAALKKTRADDDLTAEWIGPVLVLWRRFGAVAVVQDPAAEVPWSAAPEPGQYLWQGEGGSLTWFTGGNVGEIRRKTLQAIVSGQRGLGWETWVRGQVELGAEAAMGRPAPAAGEGEWVGPWKLRWESEGPVWVDYHASVHDNPFGNGKVSAGDRMLKVGDNVVKGQRREVILSWLRAPLHHVSRLSGGKEVPYSCW